MDALALLDGKIQWMDLDQSLRTQDSLLECAKLVVTSGPARFSRAEVLWRILATHYLAQGEFLHPILKVLCTVKTDVVFNEVREHFPDAIKVLASHLAYMRELLGRAEGKV